MVYQKTNVHITAIDYEVVYDSDKKIATITPVVHADCTKAQILVASVWVDGHELRSSLKLVLEEGTRTYRVPYVKIMSPILSGGETGDFEYKMTFRIHLDGEEVYDLDNYIKIVDS